MNQSTMASELRTNNNLVREAHDDRVTEVLSRVEHNLNDLVQGLSLLGVKRCSWCQSFLPLF